MVLLVTLCGFTSGVQVIFLLAMLPSLYSQGVICFIRLCCADVLVVLVVVVVCVVIIRQRDMTFLHRPFLFFSFNFSAEKTPPSWLQQIPPGNFPRQARYSSKSCSFLPKARAV